MSVLEEDDQILSIYLDMPENPNVSGCVGDETRSTPLFY